MSKEKIMLIEQVFSSRGKTRLIQVLFKLGEANISKLSRLTGLHHKLVDKYLTQLKKLQIVEEHKYGRLRIFKVNYSNPKTYILKELLELMESQESG